MPHIADSGPILEGSNIDLRQKMAEDVRSTKRPSPPELIQYEVGLTADSLLTILNSRAEARQIIRRESDRLLVLVGPCSIHDPEFALEYASRLRELATELRDDICIVMRAYFEKPRTTILDTISPQFTADLITVGAIGARTTESQLHRELASGLSFPVGFKNATDGTVKTAVDSRKSMRAQYHFMGTTKRGLNAITTTKGNDDGYVILYGGSRGTNYDSESVKATRELLRSKGERDAPMIDCSHGKSQKNHLNQPKVLKVIEDQLRQGEVSIIGVMVESNIHDGNQKSAPGPQDCEKGVSITNACIYWETTEASMRSLAQAVWDRWARAAFGKGQT
ncbi:uncharacterized protein ASPGLDRAFT_1492429 [Aspergillus glaucus CBS 516.65]|uniref:Phospho-2-dehydro-3-deoxyheptonate aldolase n=1 Tax=Aspergillus glaucus CBS 516.65 TaxID=1160497 RepID=A0A1L9VJB4_ASPGL|nr:hypothetical protein ASPGLDRAFT_1492429 [Aspergillus glaucus CBS 516.65]OJJ84017.1 hypothetical protein ASPGLDRAFT_1492429 [Aspergillus glaucus CBS 516.65]